MQQLSSNNYHAVVVKLREGDPITMPVDKGLALMDWLTKEQKASHVRITGDDGSVTLVSKHDIKAVEPILTDEAKKRIEKKIMEDVINA